ARYIHGFNYKPADLKLALLEASAGKIAESIGDWMIHKCYRYDPAAGAYSLQAMAVMRIGGAISIVAIASLLIGLFMNERIRRGRRARTVPTSVITDQSTTPRPSNPSAPGVIAGAAR